MTTTFPRPVRNWRDDPNLTPRMKLRVEIERTCQSVYEANTDRLSDQLFLSAVHAIGGKYAKLRGEVARQWGIRSSEYTIAAALIDAQETQDLTQALAAWKCERHREDSADADEVEFSLAAE